MVAGGASTGKGVHGDLKLVHQGSNSGCGYLQEGGGGVSEGNGSG